MLRKSMFFIPPVIDSKLVARATTSSFVQHTIGGKDAPGLISTTGFGFDVDQVDVVVVELPMQILFEGGTSRTKSVRRF
jgi:hypothetical protein